MENPQIPSLLNKKRTGNNELADNEGWLYLEPVKFEINLKEQELKFRLICELISEIAYSAIFKCTSIARYNNFAFC